MVRTHVKLVCEEDWAFIGMMVIHSELNTKWTLLLFNTFILLINYLAYQINTYHITITLRLISISHGTKHKGTIYSPVTWLPRVQGQHRQHDQGFIGHRLPQVEGWNRCRADPQFCIYWSGPWYFVTHNYFELDRHGILISIPQRSQGIRWSSWWPYTLNLRCNEWISHLHLSLLDFMICTISNNIPNAITIHSWLQDTKVRGEAGTQPSLRLPPLREGRHNKLLMSAIGLRVDKETGSLPAGDAVLLQDGGSVYFLTTIYI